MDDDSLSNISQWMEEDESNLTTTFLVTSTASSAITSTVKAVHQTPPSNEIFRYFQLSSLTLVAIVGLISNALVLLLFYKRPTLRSFSNRFVLNLSISHFWQSILVLPTTVISVANGQWVLGSTLCVVSGFLFTMLNITSILSLLLIALDRNCAVNSPLHYSMTVTKTRTGLLILATWLLGAAVAAPPFLDIVQIQYRQDWHMCTLVWQCRDSSSVAYVSVLVVMGFVVPLFTTVCVYSSMFQAARDNSERARKHSVNSTLTETAVPESGPVPAKKKFRRWSSGSDHFFGEEWKAVRTGFLVVMTFTFCWLPYFSVTSYEAYFSSSQLPGYVLFTVVLCIFSACAINPYIYVFRNKTSRKNIKQMLSSSNLVKNKNWMLQKQSKDKTHQTSANPCILAASLVNESSEKVEALPALFQDVEGKWQMYSTSEERSREDIEDTMSNVSDEDFFDTGIHRIIFPPNRRRHSHSGSINVPAIYNTTYSRNVLAKTISSGQAPNSSNRLLLCRLKTSLNHDSTSSDTTENCSMSLESNNSNDNQTETESSSSKRGIGKYLFNTFEEFWDSKAVGSQHKRIGSFSEESSSSHKALSSFGRARRKSFIHSHLKNKKSSETTLTSSTNSETLEPSSAASDTSTIKISRPKLVRQEDISQPPDDHTDP